MPFNSFDHYPMSWKPNKNQLRRPIYRSLAQLLEHDINHGFLAPGTKLPPQRELADYLDVNFTTITRAYKLCELKGLLYGVTGNGTFVGANAARSVTISKEHNSNKVIDLGFVASYEQTNEMVSEVIKQVAEKNYLEQLLNYNDPSGIPHHKLAALNWMQTLGIQADTEHVAIVSGAQNAIAITLFALFEPGNRIAVDVYTYANFIEISKMYQIRLVPILGDEHGMLPDALEEQCQQMNIDGVFLMPSCANPTTIMMPIKRKMELAHVIQKYALILIEDDFHAFLSAGTIDHYGQPMYQMLPNQTVYICSTSKSICSGLRVAYVVFNEVFKSKMIKAIYNVNVKTSSLDVEIITELILTGQAQKIVERKKQLAEEGSQLFRKYFSLSPQAGHPLSFFRWLPIPQSKKNLLTERYFLDNGIRVFHSNRFLSSFSKEPDHLRVALSSTSNMEELKVGLKLLSELLNLYQR
ncbi:PLP-dependent aminotransferase family protein [Paenibacillus sp. ACRRY]|uniref:aminotransferase-like domain-containing protein n=1 Tax=Paenibacillus sp. ACRRY TaxID=2918208 RepID=UPI001EF4067F|nr:PLP-dependent aminotransferase family protein [Paenibacillus sp. ACRRY]MCG7381724.1 PLP-dependent aminotransferase family protein [Paenibacillus sp. ACRRY]